MSRYFFRSHYMSHGRFYLCIWYEEFTFHSGLYVFIYILLHYNIAEIENIFLTYACTFSSILLMLHFHCPQSPPDCLLGKKGNAISLKYEVFCLVINWISSWIWCFLIFWAWTHKNISTNLKKKVIIKFLSTRLFI